MKHGNGKFQCLHIFTWNIFSTWRNVPVGARLQDFPSTPNHPLLWGPNPKPQHTPTKIMQSPSPAPMIAMPRGIVGHHPLGFRTPRSPRSVARRPVAPNSKPSGGSSGDATAPQRGALGGHVLRVGWGFRWEIMACQ